MERGNRWSDRWIDGHREERGRMNARVCVWVGVCVRARMWRDWRKSGTRVAQENEKRRTVFIMLMPCNYSWPWPKIDVDIVGCWLEPRGGFYPLLTLSFSYPYGHPSISFSSFAQRYACFSIRRIPRLCPGMKWFRGWRSNRTSPIPTLRRWKFFLPPLILVGSDWRSISSFLYESRAH